MTRLEDEIEDDSPVRTWLIRGGILLAIILFVGSVVWIGRGLVSNTSAPKRQTVKIAVLPDEPPPPPPPPKEEKQPEPKEQPKAMDVPKPDQPPAPQQLKMEGPAGDGPSPFAGGDVHNDYAGGEIGDGSERERFIAYSGRLSQFVQDELARRNLRGAGAKVLFWLAADGTVERFKLVGVTGGDSVENELKAALGELRRVGEAPPSNMPMPVGLDISVQ